MARLVHFLREGNTSDDTYGRSVPIEKYAFDNYIKKNCSKSMFGSPLYRGIRNVSESAKYLFIDPSKHTRRSEYTTNYYMLLLQFLPNWKKFPNLSKSVICTTSRNDAMAWGQAFQVYPFDGAELAVTPKEHLWASFPEYFGSMAMDDVSNIISYLLRYSKNKSYVGKQETDPNKLKHALELINSVEDREQVINDIFNDYGLDIGIKIEGKVLIDKWASHEIEDIIDVFEKLLDPSKFILTKIGATLPNKKQVWTESPCVLSRIEGYF
jgi:hypothetical protein